MDGWARVDGRSAWAASWARTDCAMMAARVLSQILASDREKERMVPMKDLEYFDCGWLMLIMELGAMAAQLVG
jgi:hypothetical protein